jgi:hypothetical protein
MRYSREAPRLPIMTNVDADLQALADYFRDQAEACRGMAEIAATPNKSLWVNLSASWTKLALEAEARKQPT